MPRAISRTFSRISAHLDDAMPSACAEARALQKDLWGNSMVCLFGSFTRALSLRGAIAEFRQFGLRAVP